MDQAPATEETQAPIRHKKPALIRWAPIIVVVFVVGTSFAIVSRPTPGTRTTTATSASVVINTTKADDDATFPIALQEGGDPEHEFDHVIGPLQGVEGISSATLDWSSGLVLRVTYDSASVSSQEIAALLSTSGYLAAPK